MNERKHFKNIKHKLYLLLPTLFLLTGCGPDNSDYVFPNKGWLSQLGENLQWMIDKAWLTLTQWFYNLILMLHSTSTEFGQDAIDNVFTSFTNLSFLDDIIKVSSFIGILFVLLRYGWGVFKYYSVQLDEGVSPLTIDYIKKTVFALLFILIAPYIIINGFYLTTVVTSYAVNELDKYTKDEFSLEEAFNDYHVNLQTWCGPQLEKEGYGIPENDIAEEDDNVKIKEEADKNVPDTPKDLSADYNVLWPASSKENYTGAKMGKMYDMFCANKNTIVNIDKDKNGNYKDAAAYKPINVYVAIQHTPELARQTPAGGILSLGVMLISFLFGIFTAINTGIRTAELLVLLMMTPFFSMQFISVKQSEALSTWSKELISIFMSHAVAVILFKIFMLGSMQVANLGDLSLLIGLAIIQLRGPSAVRAWSHNTGSFGIASAAMRGIRK